ncbi:hypothetical protein IWW45_006772 [Coemansia sp. RSA 485]|nr:hypothetical protein IWW45_006772 [Coemansia sp. RSA 485]
MEYESYYMSLWNRLSQSNGDTQLDCVQLEKDVCKFESVLENVSDTASISSDQWTGSLAVAGSLAAQGFAWSNSGIAAAANKWIAMILSHINECSETCVTKDEHKITSKTFRSISTTFVHPYFATGSRDASTTYTLTGVREKRTHVFGKQKWKTNLQSIACFAWALEHVRPEDTIDVISFILPVVLALIDDYDTKMKTRGLRLAITLMTEKIDTAFLRKSGIAGILEKSIEPSLVFRSDEGQLGVELLEAGFEAATLTTRIQYTQIDHPRYTEQWWKLAERIVANTMYVSDKVSAMTVLCSRISVICQALGPAISRYLRPLVGLLVQAMRSSVFIDSRVCKLHMTVVGQFSELTQACLPRIHVYVEEIIAALAYSWCSTQSRDCTAVDDVRELRSHIVELVRKFKETCPQQTNQALSRLLGSRPGAFSEWRI